MDPKYRTMLRVNLEDAMEADETFSVLMGDKVKPDVNSLRKTRNSFRILIYKRGRI